jgi:hypothetical protein
MSYANFTLSELKKKFGLEIDERTDLFSDTPEATLRPGFQERINEALPLAATATEKARSEFLIAPVLLELWLLNDRKIGVLSGVDFNIDESLGLAGVCDYIITRSTEQLFVQAPLLMMVEAKSEVLKRGYAQCIAEMVAARTFNEREGSPIEPIHGVVTIGEMWRFIALDGNVVRIDARSYHIERLAKIMGILLALTRPVC